MAASHEVADCERLDIVVLLVDDDPTTLSVNAGLLRSWEYKVATATSGHEALKTLKEFGGFFDLVITELNMRGMNGLELQKLVNREFHVPVIIMSGDGRRKVMSRSLENGAAYCLVKPVRREDLKDVWQYAVAGRREKLMRVENDRIVPVSEEEGDSSSSSPPKKQRKKYCKRKRDEVFDNEELIYCGQKRSKILWTTNLHDRFLFALRHIGMDKAVPTKILEIMDVPGLTRDNVASHLQKYRMFLKRVADKGILEGLSERALRSRFAMGLPTDLIRDLQQRARRFRHYEHYHHQPYNTMSRPQIPQNPPTTRTRPSLANQTILGQPNHYGTDHNHRNFQQFHYLDRANHHHHRPIVNGGGFMTSANALTANGLMSNYVSLGNSRNFNYGPTNYDSNNIRGMIPHGRSGLQRSPRTNHNRHGTQLNNNSNYKGMIVPYGSSGLQGRPRTYNSHHHGTQLNFDNNNLGMIMRYGSSGLQRSSSTYNSHGGTQLNNNASVTAGAMNTVHDVGYTGHNSYDDSSSSNILGLPSNGSASNNEIVPVSGSVVNVRVEPTRANITAGLPSLAQQSINGSRNAGGGDNNDQHNTVTSANQHNTVTSADDLNELFLMLDDMVLLDKTEESPGERSSSDILNSFNVEDCIELLQGDDDHVNAQTSERSNNVLPSKSSSACTNVNPNMVMRNDASTNLEPSNMFVADKDDSASGNSTPQEQDWDMDLIETLFGAADPSQK